MLNSKDIKELLINISNVYIEKEDELNNYDSVVGDGDHGVTMARGAKATKEKLESMLEGTCSGYFKAYGMTLVSTLGGAIGPLFGSIFLELSKACKDKESIDLEELSQGITNAEIKISALGGAMVGDKTMVDSIHPAAIALKEAFDSNKNLNDALNLALKACEEGVKSTIPLVARKGRSKYLQEKAIGHQDAGATSFYFLLKEVKEYVDRSDRYENKEIH